LKRGFSSIGLVDQIAIARSLDRVSIDEVSNKPELALALRRLFLRLLLVQQAESRAYRVRGSLILRSD
jgi:hypothetical protein